jgi:nucleotidyltransferase substrate binding protein (TIGR01987 family)
MNDVRWQQRFQNFEKAFFLLRDAFENRTLESFSDLECEGLIQRFEYSFELGWNTMKDFLEFNGIVIAAPVGARSTIKAAFASGLITDGQVWIDMMLHRNQLSHMYDSVKAEVVLRAVRERYLAAMASLHGFLAGKREDVL